MTNRAETQLAALPVPTPSLDQQARAVAAVENASRLGEEFERALLLSVDVLINSPGLF